MGWPSEPVCGGDDGECDWPSEVVRGSGGGARAAGPRSLCAPAVEERATARGRRSSSGVGRRRCSGGGATTMDTSPGGAGAWPWPWWQHLVAALGGELERGEEGLGDGWIRLEEEDGHVRST
jgi:hypothetical protein